MGEHNHFRADGLIRGSHNVITVTISQFGQISGIGRTRIYELLDTGEIESVTIGRRRLVILRSYINFLERRRMAEAGLAGARRAAR